MARQGRQAIDSVLNDLLASDSEDVPSQNVNWKKKNPKVKGKSLKLTSETSDAEFYQNLKSITGDDVYDDDDVSGVDSISMKGAERLANDIGNLDDLDDDLFAGFIKKETKPAQGKLKKTVPKKRNSSPDFDPDDPLAGLLSDEDDLGTKGKHQSTVSNKLHDAKRKNKQQSTSPHTKVNIDNKASPQQPIVKRDKQLFCKSLESPSNARDGVMRETTKSEKKNEDDFFADDDQLPGFSDEESTEGKEQMRPKKNDDLIPSHRATSALDNLLGVQSPWKEKKKEPTMLERMMSKKKETKEPEKSLNISYGEYNPSTVDETSPRSVHSRLTKQPSVLVMKPSRRLSTDDILSNSEFKLDRKLPQSKSKEPDLNTKEKTQNDTDFLSDSFADLIQKPGRRRITQPKKSEQENDKFLGLLQNEKPPRIPLLQPPVKDNTNQTTEQNLIIEKKHLLVQSPALENQITMKNCQQTNQIVASELQQVDQKIELDNQYIEQVSVSNNNQPHITNNSGSFKQTIELSTTQKPPLTDSLLPRQPPPAMKESAVMRWEQEKYELHEELRLTKEKVNSCEEKCLQWTEDFESKIRELETEIKDLKLERDFLVSSQETLKRRHKEEVESLEMSHVKHSSFVETSFNNRLKQTADDSEMIQRSYEEKMKMMAEEKKEAVNGLLKRLESKDATYRGDIERLVQSHKKAMDMFAKEHEDQLNHAHKLKDFEVESTINALSSTKSLHDLIEDVRNSSKEMTSFQSRLEVSHQARLQQQEVALQTRCEHLNTLEERVRQQEKSNEIERVRLQTLITKLEIQLSEQTRQIEQDKWKLTQDENRLQSLQATLEEERNSLSQRMEVDRAELSRGREAMLAEQCRIIANCQEEKRSLSEEKMALQALKQELLEKKRSGQENAMQMSMNRYQSETATFSARLIKVREQEDRLASDKEKFVSEETELRKEFERLREAGEIMQDKSQELEQYAMEAKRVREIGMHALQEAETMRMECVEIQDQMAAKSEMLLQQEVLLKKEISRLARARKIDAARFNCKRNNFSGSLRTDTHASDGNQEDNLLTGARTSTPFQRPDMSSTQYLETSNPNPANFNKDFHGENKASAPPDLLLDHLQFAESMKKWSSEREKDKGFIEEQTRFLNSLSKKN